MKQGLLITKMFGHGVNQANGDFSKGAQGFYIENGIISHPVSGVTVAGNLIDMFRSMKFSSDVPSKYIINSPHILLSSVVVACQ